MLENIFHSVNRVAGGQVLDCSIVKDGDPDVRVVQAGEGDVCAGVSRKGRGQATSSYEGNVIALEGDSVEVIVDGYCLVRAGASFSRGDWLGSDADGRAVFAVGGDPGIGIAMQGAGTVDELVIIKVIPYLGAQWGAAPE